MTEPADPMMSRLMTTYATADGARVARRGGTIRIHVGQAVWDWMKEQTTDAVPGWDPLAHMARFFGFDIMLEAAWEPNRIVVRTDQEIA